MYCAYAFGVPITLGVIAFLLNNLKLIPEEFRNKAGTTTCLVGGSTTVEFIYVFCPVIITLSINAIFYLITALKIYRVQKATNFKGGESKRHSNEVEKMRFGKCGKFT